MPDHPFHYEVAEPSAGCRAFVKQLFFARGLPGYERETLIPMGHPTLLVNLGEPFLRIQGSQRFTIAGGTLHFQQTRSAEHLFCGETHVVGAALMPDGAFAILGSDVSARTDTVSRMDTCAPKSWPGTETRLVSARADATACLRILDDALAAHPAARADALVNASLLALSRDPGRPIAELASAGTISHKQLIARFKARVGTTPKRFAALLRMRTVARAVARTKAPNWAAMALLAGYADQAHFSRAFKSFTGLSPTDYQERRLWSVDELGHGDDSGSFVPHPEHSSPG